MRDLFLILTIIFTFAALVGFVVGVLLAADGLRDFDSWLETNRRFWPLGVADGFLALAAFYCHSRYKHFLKR